MKLKNQGKRLGGLLFLSFFLAPGVHAKAAKAVEADWYVNINRAMMHVNDGFQKDTYFVDNNSKSSRAGITGEKVLDDHFKVGGKMEMELVTSSSASVNQLNRNATGVVAKPAGAARDISNTNAVHDGIKIRQIDTWLKGSFGQLSLGHGSMASWTTVASDLSGTADTIGYVGPWLMAGGMNFHNNTSTSKVAATDPTVLTVFSPYDIEFARQSRVRYDTPSFAGFSLSGSVYNGASESTATLPAVKYGSDTALRYSNKFNGVKLLGAVAFSRLSKGSNIKNQKIWDASFAALHEATGINAAINVANKTLANNTATLTKKQKFNRVQLGLISDLNCYGPTNFVVDYAQSKNALENDAKGKGYGFGVVQQLKKVNSEVYVSIRRLKFDRPLADLHYNKMLAAMAGIRVSFGGKLAS